MPDKTLTLRERRAITACDADGLITLLAAEEKALTMLRYLAEWLRQGGVAQANDRLLTFNRALEKRDAAREHIGRALHQWLQALHVYASFVNVGIFARTGILHETRILLYDRINPLPVDESQLQDVLDSVFNGSKDLEWLATISPLHWVGRRTKPPHPPAHARRTHLCAGNARHPPQCRRPCA